MVAAKDALALDKEAEERLAAKELSSISFLAMRERNSDIESSSDDTGADAVRVVPFATARVGDRSV